MFCGVFLFLEIANMNKITEVIVNPETNMKLASVSIK